MTPNHRPPHSSDYLMIVVCNAPFMWTFVLAATVILAIIGWVQGSPDRAALTVGAIALPATIVSWITRYVVIDAKAAACPDPQAHEHTDDNHPQRSTRH